MHAAKRPRALTDHGPGPDRIAHQLARLPEPTRTLRLRGARRDLLLVNHRATIGGPIWRLGALRNPLGIDGPAIGLGALQGPLPVNDLAIINERYLGLGAFRGPLPVNEPTLVRGPDRGLRRRAPAVGLGLRAGCSPNTHHRRQHGPTPRPARFMRHSRPQTPHHIRVHSQIAAVAASEAPHCSLVPSLTYRYLPSTTPAYQPLPSGPSLDEREYLFFGTALISVWA